MIKVIALLFVMPFIELYLGTKELISPTEEVASCPNYLCLNLAGLHVPLVLPLVAVMVFGVARTLKGTNTRLKIFVIVTSLAAWVVIGFITLNFRIGGA